MIVIECEALEGEPHEHEYPDDWIFGGANGLHPGPDPRFRPTRYTYYNSDVTELYVTSEFTCDWAALDAFTKVGHIAGSDPKWISVKRPGEKEQMLPWLYDKTADEVYRNA